jgi:hypothetical protein
MPGAEQSIAIGKSARPVDGATPKCSTMRVGEVIKCHIHVGDPNIWPHVNPSGQAVRKGSIKCTDVTRWVMHVMAYWLSSNLGAQPLVSESQGGAL